MKKSFSERIGATPAKTIQIGSMDDDLRNSLWNLAHDLYDWDRDKSHWLEFATRLARYFFKVPIDEIPAYNSNVTREWIKKKYYNLTWNRTYEFLEFLVDNHNSRYHSSSQDRVREFAQYILERELSGYRFVSDVLTPITDRAEIEEIAEAIESSKLVGLEGAHQHIKTALIQLGKKPDPDYRNAIKEAISAIESVACVLSKKEKSKGLDDPLNELSKYVEIHPALKEGFIKLYGYASDEDGVRHKIIDQPNVGFTEAKYMIVACSAFVNYLIGKADEAGLFKKK